MIVKLEIPEYNNDDGLTIHWENAFTIEVNFNNEITYIKANKEGLVSLAIQLLTLAQDTVEPGRHIHYDYNNSLEDGSSDLVIEKIR